MEQRVCVRKAECANKRVDGGRKKQKKLNECNDTHSKEGRRESTNEVRLQMNKCVGTQMCKKAAAATGRVE